MGASAGPNLVGIGRGGDSNLVLEMDAHDAKSYPGEPTSNIFSNPNNWTGSDWTQTNGTIANNAAEGPNGGSAGSITATNADPYIYSNLVHSVATGGLTFSCWVKGVGSSVGKSGDIRINFSGTATGSATTVDYTLTGLWQRVSISGTVTGAGTIKVGLEPPNSAAVGDVVYLADAQLEQKGYATPFVREGKGGTGTYDARPASVNLMIHGNVGTGQSFYDSSPSKHTVTANGDTTHSGDQSKFSGGSIYFDGSDSLSIAGSTDFDFGTGDFTVDCWSNVTSSYSGYNTVWENGLYTDGILFRFSSSHLYVYVNGTYYIAYAGSWSANTWYHLALLRTGTTLRLFVDGVQRATATVTADIQPSNNAGTSPAGFPNSSFIIGRSNHTTSQWFTGLIDEFRVTKGTALWTAAFTPPTRRNLSAPVVDRSGNYNGGNFNTKETTDVATYRDGEVIKPVDSAVWDYDGTDDKISIATDSVDIYCFTIAIKQDKEYTPDLTPGNPNVGFVMGGNTFNGIIVGSWTGTMTDETLSWWGYSSTPTTGSSATYIRDTILAGWHIFTFNWNGSDYDIWVDGTKRTTYPRGGGSGHSGLFKGVTAITPGWSGSGWNGYFEGKMGFFRAYDKSLSDQQIIENFHSKRNSLNVPNWSNRDIVQSGLIRWLDFGEAACYPGGQIGTVNDLKTGTAYTVSNSDGGITPSGEGGGCFAFAGTTDDKIPFTATANLPACTVSVWVYNISGGDVRQTLFGHYWEITYDRLQMYSYGFSNLGWRFSTSGSVPYNTWTNAVMTWDGSNVKAYINGALNYTNTVGPGGYAGGFYEISVNWARLKAKLATALIYDRALSASELEQNFIVQRQRFGV